MGVNYRTAESLKDLLVNRMESYVEGNCNLDDVITIADKLISFKQNVGYQHERRTWNQREKAFHDQWLEENAPLSGINHGQGILQDLFIKSDDLLGFSNKWLEEITSRDRMIVATVIQWLGSNCGMCFLGEALKRFDAKIVYNKKAT